MGEYADMMLDGTCCEGCGEFIGKTTGFPGYCSRQCANDRGVSCDSPRQQKDKPFIVKGRNAFPALKPWLRERGCNVYSHSRDDIINVGYSTDPSSDWGKYTPKGYIILKDKSLFDETCKAIEKAFGWKRPASA